MPKVRVTESGAVGEPPDSSIRYLTLTMTEMRHMTPEILDALLRLLFRDRRGVLYTIHCLRIVPGSNSRYRGCVLPHIVASI